jgi:hypothetical protein
MRRVVIPLSNVFLVLGLYWTPPMQAQQKKAAVGDLEDPELYHAFFRSHTDADLKIQASSQAAASQLSSATAALYGITPDDLPKLTAAIRKFNVSMGAWYLQQQHYLSQQRAAKQPPDIKILVKNQRERQRLIMNTHGAIHAALKRSNWAALHGYINGDFKANWKQGGWQQQGKGGAGK